MKSLGRYPTFVILLIHSTINANYNMHNEALLWKRAREKSIDLNQTPSPNWSVESNKASPVSPVESTSNTKTRPSKRRWKKTKLSFKEIKDAYDRRKELYKFEEQKRIAIEKEYKQAFERKRQVRSRYRKNVWLRIRTGKARESDLRIRESTRKSSIKWQKANRDKMNEYQRKYDAKKRKKDKQD